MTIRGPLYTPRQTKRPFPLQDIQNLQVSTLTTSAQPLIRFEWQVPRKTGKPSPAFEYQNLLETTLAPAVQAAPIVPILWPVPPKRPQNLGMHVFYAMSYLETGYPFVYPDLNQYRPSARTKQTEVIQNTLLNMPVVAQSPFRQQDWQNPTTKHARAPDVIQDFQTFIALQPMPIISQEMQNPFKRGKTQQPDVLQNLQLSLYATFPQIRQEISDPVKKGKTQQPPHVWQGLANFYAQQPTPKIAQEHQNPVKKGKTQQPYEFQNLQFNTLLVPDSTPDAFTFTDQTGVALNTPITSDPITVTGINQAVAISVVGGSYSINGAAFTAAPGTVSNGDSVRAQVTSSGSALTATSATVTIGGISDTFTATTALGEDTRVIVPYLIGSTAAHATQQLASVYLNIAISGTTGTVTAQDVPFMSLVNRYTVVTVTLGGTIYNPSKGKRLPTYNAPDRLQ